MNMDMLYFNNYQIYMLIVVNINQLLHKVVREDDKLFHALVVPVTFSKYVLHQMLDALGHNDIARAY